jgi:tRNA (cmo5U34)-methyltransferase
MKNGFDRIAKVYNFLSRLVFGKSIVRSQLCFLNYLESNKSVLILGGGTGWHLNHLLYLYPYLKITFVDSSSKMINIAKKKLKPGYQVKFICDTYESIAVDEKFDAVILYYFLDLFPEEELPKAIQSINRNMKLKSRWLVSDFVNNKPWHSFMLELMYTFFRYTTRLKTRELPDWRKYLNENFTFIEQRSFYCGFIQALVYQSSQ